MGKYRGPAGSQGAPKGNKSATNHKLFKDALRKALADPKQDKLRLIAERLVFMAMEGDIYAIKEIADRLDGKPQQAITDTDGGEFIVQVVKFASKE